MDKKTVNGVDPMEQFFTAAKAGSGVKLFLDNAVGMPTGEWLLIRGADAEEFRLVDAAGKREAVALAGIKDEAERDRKVFDLTRRMAATLVMAWSFKKECTLENVIEFFKQAPQIEQQVDRAATTRMLFSKVASDNSTHTPAQSSSST